MNEEILEVKIKKKEVNLIVWIIPIISLIVGGWLIYKYYSSLGPLITIQFKNSGGLEPKRSVVKFRDVAVGQVEKVEIMKRNEGVLVYVRMHKDMKPFLNDTTKFWIVKPQIALTQVRGLDALLSGPYIQMYAKPKGFTKEKFKGLDNPPLDSFILNSKILKLVADSTYGLSEKLPIFYKHIKVGSIRKINLKNNGKVEIIISINNKYTKFLNDSTKFWNVKKIDISLSKNYLQLSTPSLKELIFGGIAFDTLDFNKSLTKKVFELYPSKAEAFANKLGDKAQYKEFIAVFDRQNSLLNANEVIKFRGFNVGFIKEVKSYFDFNKDKIISFAILKINVAAFNTNIKKLFDKGISVALKKDLFGAYLDLVFTKKAYSYEMLNGRAKINVIYKPQESIADKLSKFLDKLNALPLKESINNFNEMISKTTPLLSKTLLSISKMSDNISNFVSNPKINQLLDNSNELLKTLNDTLKTYSNNSLFYKKVSKVLYDIDKTTNNLNRLIIKIDKKPNSILLGD